MPTVISSLGVGVMAGLFSGTISIGVAVITLVFLAGLGYFAMKYKLTELAQEQTKAANEAASTWRDNYLAERQRADDMEKRYQEQRALKHEALTALATEKLKTDQTAVLKALAVSQEALRSFHDDFLSRDAVAAEIRATVVATEERIVTQLAEIAHALTQLQNGGQT